MKEREREGIQVFPPSVTHHNARLEKEKSLSQLSSLWELWTVLERCSRSVRDERKRKRTTEREIEGKSNTDSRREKTFSFVERGKNVKESFSLSFILVLSGSSSSFVRVEFCLSSISWWEVNCLCASVSNKQVHCNWTVNQVYISVFHVFERREERESRSLPLWLCWKRSKSRKKPSGRPILYFALMFVDRSLDKRAREIYRMFRANCLSQCICYQLLRRKISVRKCPASRSAVGSGAWVSFNLAPLIVCRRQI